MSKVAVMHGACSSCCSSSPLLSLQAIESLTQTVLKLEKDRELQQHRIQTLEEEVRRLRTRGEEEQRRSPEWRLERRVEEWKKEVTSELYSLRAQLQREAERAGSQGQQEIQDSKKLLREECETLRREVEHIKLQLKSKYATGLNSELEGSDIGETGSDLEDDSDVASFAAHPDELSDSPCELNL
ncbi:hypothetical protein EOD39_11866 [Acipenser ruthenus]|uniref:Uncharacterized protein n=1 Tax=Acipenser ruthenus TaxID=7906 RepID=A0A662YRR6_ACIRT|nr:hypothetical protein EOD39_11866 [Acipenser ruthenus]